MFSSLAAFPTFNTIEITKGRGMQDVFLYAQKPKHLAWQGPTGFY
jgi:hypothetical protein